jgi:hypothetical protein
MSATIRCNFALKEKVTMKIKTRLKAGGTQQQHNQKAVRSLKVKAGVRAGEDKPPVIK